jgi:hypothetical protein
VRHLVTTYRGTERGWIPCGSGRPRLKGDALRLAALMQRIDPDRYLYRVEVLEPELPNFL